MGYIILSCAAYSYEVQMNYWDKIKENWKERKIILNASSPENFFPNKNKTE